MSNALRATLAFSFMAIVLVMVGMYQSWALSLTIINLCLISSVMALGVNIQWGYAGLFNIGIMGFAALGGAAAMLVSMPPVTNAWAAGGWNILYSALGFIGTIVAAVTVYRKLPRGRLRSLAMVIILVAGYMATRYFFAPAVSAIEATDSAKTGYLGGLGLPIILSWPVGGLFAAGAAWVIGKVVLGLRSDYLAIATLGISEIVVAILKNEDWLTRGVKNVNGLPRPVPYELQLQQSEWFTGWVERFYAESLAGLEGAARSAALKDALIEASSIFVKLCYARAVHSGTAYYSDAVCARTKLALGSYDARHPRQRNRRGSHGQGCHRPPPAGVYPWFSGVRYRRRHADNPRRPVNPDLLYTTALYLPYLGDGDRRRAPVTTWARFWAAS